MFLLGIRYFPFLDGIFLYKSKYSGCQGNFYCTATRRSDNIYLVQSWFVSHTNKLEQVYFVDEEFMHKKVNKNSVYMRIMVRYRRYSRRLRQPESSIMGN